MSDITQVVEELVAASEAIIKSHGLEVTSMVAGSRVVDGKDVGYLNLGFTKEA